MLSGINGPTPGNAGSEDGVARDGSSDLERALSELGVPFRKAGDGAFEIDMTAADRKVAVRLAVADAPGDLRDLILSAPSLAHADTKAFSRVAVGINLMNDALNVGGMILDPDSAKIGWRWFIPLSAPIAAPFVSQLIGLVERTLGAVIPDAMELAGASLSGDGQS